LELYVFTDLTVVGVKEQCK